MSSDALLDALDPEQRSVALALRGPVRVLAGAGTGKTRAITHRIAYGIRTGTYRPANVLAVTFTARAAGEMRTRLRLLGAPGVQARTFHSAALRQLSFFWPKVVGGAVPRLAEAKAQLVAEGARRVGLPVDRETVRDLASEVEWAKVSLVVPDDYEKAVAATDRPMPAGCEPQAVARLLAAYEQVKDERVVIDFEDVLLLLAGMLSERRDVAETVREQYTHFVVDEYQDVSPLQQHLLEQWLGGRSELCVVGDPSQTIYSFAGATPYHLTSFTQRYPKATTVELVRDYRSTPQVVALANRVIAQTRRAGGPRPLELRAQRPDGPEVAYTTYPDDEAEAAGVARGVARLVASGVKPSDIAILYRVNAQSEAFEAALADAGIGYQVHGNERFFARRDVRDALVLLRGGARSADPEVPMPETVRDILRSTGWSDEAPAARGAVRERWDAMQALVAVADALAADPPDGRARATVADLVAELDERAAAQHAPTVEGVTLASLHAAKGLEWDAVFLVGAREGLIPTLQAETAAAIAEERRLLYVGVTRAREHLHVSYARAARPGGRATRTATRFLRDVWPDGRDSRGSGGTARGSAGPARLSPGRAAGTGQAHSSAGAAGDARGSAGPAGSGSAGSGDALEERLAHWCTEHARAHGLAQSSVLTAEQIAALARARPRTVGELAQVQGIGQRKIAQIGAQLLAVVAGTSPVAPRSR